jgi:hypothetical protein
MINDNLMRKYPWCLLFRTYKLSLIWVVRQTIRNEKMDVYLWKYPWSEVLDKLYYTLLYPIELCCTLLWIDASFFELRCTLWAPLQPLNYTAPSELRCTTPSWHVFYELCCTPLSFPVPYWATLYLTKLHRCTLLPHCTPISYAVPHRAIQHPVNYAATFLSEPSLCKLRSTLRSYAAS